MIRYPSQSTLLAWFHLALKQKHINDRVETFVSDAQRALQLYQKLVMCGYTAKEDAEYASPLMQPDRRDIAQFIFFELAAKFESLMRDLFEFETRIRIADSPSRVRYMMGTVDGGTDGVHGWASPKRLKSRGENLFGKVGFFAKLTDHIPGSTHQRVTLAHKIRNHIAHSGTKTYRDALSSLHVPASERSGCGPGRLLIDYPSTAAEADRWFNRFVDAYVAFAETAKLKLRAPRPIPSDG